MGDNPKEVSYLSVTNARGGVQNSENVDFTCERSLSFLMAAIRGRERHPAALVGETEPDLILLIIVVMGDLRISEAIREGIRCGDKCADFGRPLPIPILDGEVILSRRFTPELNRERCRTVDGNQRSLKV